ncbi:MAG TPA: 30S ribosomal protein S6 [Bacteroidota bacterium]|nr:30S ribosomal protein S6 [Bacteroidota bacterium]
MSSARKTYETTYIVNASLEDSQIEAAITHVAEVIERNGGAITATNRWGRKRLAYPIEKKNNGFYVNIEFAGPGQLIGQLERVYILDENILRFLTIQLDKHAIAAKAKSAAEMAVPEAPEPPKPPAKEPESRAPLFAEEN